MIRMHRRLIPALFLLVSLAACSDDQATPPGTITDTTAPGAVNDLTAIEVSTSTALLTWTAPAEDGASGGTVAGYDLRFRIGFLDGAVWETARQVEDEPSPSEPGRAESLLLRDLEEGTDYAMGIRSVDDAGLLSPLSNVVLLTTTIEETPGDTIPPDPVSDLSILDVGSHHVTLLWTATGDDGVEGNAAAYDVRYRLDDLDEQTWNLSTVAVGIPTPGPPGTLETMRISDLTPETTYGIALRVLDEVPNRSELSNRIQVTTNPRASEFIDPRGLGSNSATGDIYVADHGDSSIWSIGLISRPRRIAVIPGVLGVVRSADGLFYAAAGTDEPNSGSLWSFTLSAAPILLSDGLGIPNDIDIDPAGNPILATRDPGQVVRVDPFVGIPEVLVDQSEAEFTGIATDASGNLYFGVREGPTESIRRRDGHGNIVNLQTTGAVSDLVADPGQQGIWYLDPQAGVVIRLAYDGSSTDTLATGLRTPVAITPSPTAPGTALYYSSRDGFVLKLARQP